LKSNRVSERSKIMGKINFFKKHNFVSAVIIGIISGVFGFGLYVFANNPLYAPGQTLNPSCSLGSPDCTTSAPAISGANSDITSLSGLTTALTANQGGTGQSVFTIGDLLIGSSTNSLVKLSVGTDGKVLMASSSAPYGVSWETVSSGLSGSGTPNQIAFWDSSNSLSSSNSFVLSNGNIGIGTANPLVALSVLGNQDIISATSTFIGSVASTTLLGAGWVRVVGRYAYLSSDSTYQYSSTSSDNLSVIDIQDPANPKIVGQISTTQTKSAEGVECAGNYCYIVGKTNNDLAVIDISKPFSPSQVGSVTSSTALASPADIALSGKYAYVIGLSSTGPLAVVDISNPTTPTIVGYATSSDLNSASTIQVKGNYAYIASPNSKLLTIWDISNPAKPVEKGKSSSINGMGSVYVEGKFAYAIGSSVFDIIDVSNPTANPLPIVGTLTVPGSPNIYTVKVAGNYAYVTNNLASGQIITIDISSSTAPAIVGTVTDSTNLNGADDITISGDYAYVTLNHAGTGALSIFRISGLNASGANIGNLYSDDATIGNNLTVGRDLYVQNGIITGPMGVYSSGLGTFSGLVLQGTSASVTNLLSVVSSSGSSYLTITSTGNVGIGTTTPSQTLTVNGGLFFGTSTTPTLYVASTTGRVGIGTSTPAKELTIVGSEESVYKDPVILASIDASSTTLGSCGWVYGVGKWAYATGNSSHAFNVIDMSSSTNPTIVGSVIDNTNLKGAEGFAVIGRYAYVVGMDSNAFNVIDVKDPTNPTIVATLTDGINLFGPEDINVVGKYAYVLDYNGNGITSIDISDPLHPRVVSFLHDGTNLKSAVTIQIKGNYAYVVARDSNAVTIVDISDPTNMAVTGTVVDGTLLQTATNEVVEGKYAYVSGTNHNSFVVIDVSSSTHPTIVASITDNTYLNYPFGIEIAGKYAYVASFNGKRITTIDISNPLKPFIVGSVFDNVKLNGADDLFISGKYLYVAVNTNGRFTVMELPGITTSALSAGNIYTNKLNIGEEMILQGNAYFNAGINVGIRGIISAGPLSVSATTLPSYFGGNLGIGTSTPQTNLQIASTSPALSLFDTNPSGRDFRLRSGGAAAGTFDIYDDNANSSRLTINSNGYVGIGTTTPQYLLDVNGDARVRGTMYFLDGTGMTAAAGTATGFSSATDLNLAADSGGLGSGAIIFSTDATNRMMLTNGGFLGIGNLTPSTMLDVSGTSTIRGNINLIGNGVSQYMYDNLNMMFAASTTGNYFLFGAGNTTSTGIDNIGIGFGVLDTLTTGSYNVGLGYGALATNATGTANVAIGYQAMNLAQNVSSTTAVGYQALQSVATTSGIYASAFGYRALASTTTGGSNSAFGWKALTINTTGGSNSAFGYNTLPANTTASNNAAFGTNALAANTGGQNSAFGSGSLQANTSNSDQSAFGYFSLRNNTNSQNSAFGSGAMATSTIGNFNSAFGYRAIYNSTVGTYNSAFGWKALLADNGNSTSTGSGNSVFGSLAAATSTLASISSSTIIGFGSGFNLSTSTANILIGYQAGYNLGVSTSNIVIGYNTDLVPMSSNTLDIANLIYATGLTYFNGASATTTLSGGLIGIGTTTPQTILQISSTSPALSLVDTNASGGEFRLRNGVLGARYFDIYDNTSSTSRLTIDNNGDVGIGTTTPAYKLQIAGDIVPTADNLYSLGTSTLRWARLYAASTTVGDLIFGNDFRIIEEAPSSTPQALIFRNQNSQEIMRLDENGNMTLAGSLNISSTNSLASSTSILGDFVGSVKNALASLGMAIENGVAHLKELIVDTFTANKANIKEVDTEQIQMKDKATGDIYCTWIENGEWKKVKSSCADLTPSDSSGSSTGSSTTSPTPTDTGTTTDETTSASTFSDNSSSATISDTSSGTTDGAASSSTTDNSGN